MLIENFNTTNETYPTFAKHENFVMDIKLPTCGLVVTLPPEQQCPFVLENIDCIEATFILDYVFFFYCWLDTSTTFQFVVGEICLLCTCVVLFVILGSTADGFFCPCLKVISDMMGLNENVAGVTLLAFGNCAPDMITGINGLVGDTRIIYSDTLGTAIFVMFGVAGAIIACSPFQTKSTTFLRDCGFTLFAVVFIFYAYHTDDAVTIVEAVFILLTYAMYIVVVITEQILVTRKMREAQRSSSGHVLNVESEHSTTKEPIDLIQQFFYSLNPIDEEEWLNGNKCIKTVMLIKSPVIVALRTLIPIVDYELDDCGWTKLLNCLHILLLPTFMIYFMFGKQSIFGVPYYLIMLLIVGPISIIVFKLTTTNQVPRFHKILAFLAMIGSMFVIYACAAEIVSVLFVLGVTTKRSNSFLGCTLLAWGNSLGDLIANISLARHGYEEMGFGACFGGPLFNMLVGIGICMLYKSATSPGYKTDKFTVGQGSAGETINIFLVLGLICFITATACNNFVLRRSTGLFMLCVYLLFLCYCILIEMEAVHPFGSSHRLEETPEAAQE